MKGSVGHATAMMIEKKDTKRNVSPRTLAHFRALKSPTNTFTFLQLPNPSNNVFELRNIRPSPTLEALKLGPSIDISKLN